MLYARESSTYPYKINISSIYFFVFLVRLSSTIAIFITYGSNIIYAPKAVRSNIAITEDNRLLRIPDINFPERATDDEITNAIIEIQIFIRGPIFIPRMLYAILDPTL